jgi:hypothetical protein
VGTKRYPISPQEWPLEAYIMKDGKRKYLGVFATAEEAHQAYCEAAKVAYGEFWSDGS